jgi:ribosomal protein S12 methylthiotransferase accessory factor
VADRAGSAANHLDSAVSLRRQRVAVVGHGLLATAISESLGAYPCFDQVRAHDLAEISDLSDLGDLVGDVGPPDEGPVLVTASDGWDCGDYERIQVLCAAHGTSWLPLCTELGRTVIGPLYTPGEPGCAQCAELRRSLANEHSAARESLRHRYMQLADQPSSWLTAITARTVAAVTADVVIRSGRPRSGHTRHAPQSGHTRHALLYVDLDTLAVSTHRFLPDPLCPACGTLPMDSPEAARITLRPRPKPSPDAYRVRPLGDADADWLRETYVDEETGLIQRVQTFTSGGLAVGAAAMRTRHHASAELSWGRTRRYRSSEIVAVLEALERYGGMAPAGRHPAVHACFAEIRDKALDPRTLGLYPPERYDRPGFPFQPFDADRVCWWVWGYSLARQEPILVPQAYAYYRTHVTVPDDPLFAYEISNGCALGSCLEEAILYGILEVVERDAFLMTWYARLPAARIGLSSARDRSIPMLAEAIEAETGYQVLTFDTTMEHGIPSVWAMAVRPAGTEQPGLACAAGAHLDPELAVSGALSELGPMLTGLIKRYREVAERSHAMVGDPSLVVTMEDHSVLYTDHEASSRLDFLTKSTQSRDFADIRRRHGVADSFRNPDLTDDVAEVVRRLRRHGLDIVVVDQTTPEHRTGGFCCVKAIVPGMLPMTFGHDNRRIHGLQRLFEVPRLLGYRDRTLLPQEVNPHPHPFP